MKVKAHKYTSVYFSWVKNVFVTFKARNSTREEKVRSLEVTTLLRHSRICQTASKMNAWIGMD